MPPSGSGPFNRGKTLASLARVIAVADGALEPADIKRRRALIVSDLQDVEREIGELQGAPPDVVPLKDLKELQRAAKAFGELPRVEQRELVALTIGEMKAYGKTKRVKITYRFPVGGDGTRESNVHVKWSSPIEGSY